MSDKTQIEVDGLPVDVDAEEYDADPEYVIRQVREKRAAVRLTEDDGNEEPEGFDQLGKSL